MQVGKTVFGQSVGALILVVATAVAGWWLGSAFGERRAAETRRENNQVWSQRLAQNLVGIHVGQRFPSFPVWAADSIGLAKDVHELLPCGGLLASVSPSCNICVDIALSLDRVRRSLPTGCCSLLLILQGDTYDALVESLDQEGVILPMYRDLEQRLIREHKVNVNPTIFLIDSSGTVRHIGAGPHTHAELSQLIDQHVGSCTQHLPDGGR